LAVPAAVAAAPAAAPDAVSPAAAVPVVPDAANASVAPAPAAAPAASGYWLQLAAFRQAAGAQGFHQQVVAKADWLNGVLAVWADDRGMQRVQAGPYPTRAEAQSAAERVRAALSLVPLVVERR
jgi:rare lipoprotein A